MRRLTFSMSTTLRALRDLATGKRIDDYDLPQSIKDSIKNRRPFTAEEINAGFARAMERCATFSKGVIVNQETKRLLELAAKAAGIDPNMLRDKTWADGPGCQEVVIRRAWAPHTDDGDSRRLEVALGISINIAYVDGKPAMCFAAGLNTSDMEEPLGDDPRAATRLAVLRAAAAIGEAMP